MEYVYPLKIDIRNTGLWSFRNPQVRFSRTMPVKEKNFADFLNELSEGSDDAWVRFITEFHGLISSIANRASIEYRDDIIQDVYVEIIKDHFRLVRQFDGGSRPAFLVYLQRIASNVARNHLRKYAKLVVRIDDVLSEIADERPDPETLLLAETELNDLRAAIRQLGDEYREVVNLLLKGFKHREIADLLDIPIGTSLTRANRAIAQLKKILKIEIKAATENILT